MALREERGERGMRDPNATSRKRLRMGELEIDVVTFAEALDAIDALITSGKGGTVFTPNVDHVVQADEDPRLRDAYAGVSLSLVDGMPLMWAARLMGQPFPEKISGSDLVLPLMRRAAARRWRVYFFGGADGVAERAKAQLEKDIPGLHVVGWSSPRVDVDEPRAQRDATLAAVRAAKPDLVMVALGAPKQELWSRAVVDELRPAVLVGCGASLDFIAGVLTRAPSWMSDAGLEWLYRLGQEPGRRWRRYHHRDPKFALILLRTMRRARRERARAAS
jgi:N-acetylglucosaminyldiphosphoundecaprenol N-acetyl-beta-D-mannosaminyltransferase